ncbi:MAG: hypothetical protein QXT67_04770 [Candidatus Bathyarchaeia archaeon]
MFDLHVESKIKSEIERKHPHLAVIETGYTKYGHPMAIVQVIDQSSPTYGIYAIMYKIDGRWITGIRSTSLTIIKRAFTRYMKHGVY